MVKKYDYFKTPFGLPRESLKRDKTHKPKMTHSVGDHIYYANIAPRKYLGKWILKSITPKMSVSILKKNSFPNGGLNNMVLCGKVILVHIM